MGNILNKKQGEVSNNKSLVEPKIEGLSPVNEETMKLDFVIKRDGTKSVLDLEKIHQVLTWATRGIEKVSISEIEMSSQLNFYDGVSTNDIHESLIKSTADLISESFPNYQYVAARLLIFYLRKNAYGSFTPPKLYNHVLKYTEANRYDSKILEFYTKEEFDEIDTFLKHPRDLNFSYAAVRQMESKYLLQDRVKKQVFETPQFLYVLVAMYLFANEEKSVRLGLVKDFYEATSQLKISLPTPIMAGVRTKTRQFSSCVLIESDDSLDSINAASSSIVKYVSQRAGIGLNVGSIRAKGSTIRNGDASHTGLIPFIKLFQSSVKSCSQGGVRGGAATLFFPLWHLEVESLLVLKNNKGVEENRARQLDYGVQINRFLYMRLINGKDITLFSPSDVPGLYENFFADQTEFESLYLKYEQDESIRKVVVSSTDLFNSLAVERAQTGRIYIHNVDNSNQHSAFNPKLAPVRQSNLCLEITLPTKPLSNINDEEGEIALCTLAAFNLGAIKNLEELEPLANVLVRALDNLLDYQDYPIAAAQHSTVNRRPLGIGVTNFAYYLAKNNLKYSDGSANELTHKTMEAFQFYLLQASKNLAKERGACPKFNETSYAQGLLPVDTYKKNLDDVYKGELLLDWEGLRSEIKKYGIRNSTLSAQMPCETSSQITNSTNGIEPPRGFVSVKSSKDGALRQVVPEYENLKDKYELLWDIPDNSGYLTLVGIMQKFIDQSISANTNYDPQKFSDGKVSLSKIIEDLLFSYQLGLKTLYYHNTKDNSDDSSHGNEKAHKPVLEQSVIPQDDGCRDGGCVL